VFSEILSPVDFTVASALAMRSALRFARRVGSRVTVLHVLEGLPSRMVLSAGEALRVIAETNNLTADVTARLRSEVQRESGSSQRVVTSVQTGVANHTILDVAQEIKADLIVMGNARRGLFDRAIVGSTSRRVINRARCPVLLVPSVAGTYDWDARASVLVNVPVDTAVS
jgi:nucleotide-binding universal stress UspA family protein